MACPLRQTRADRDHNLLEAIARAERGLIDADLGGGKSSSSGWRDAVRDDPADTARLHRHRAGERAVFLFALAKHERENIGPGRVPTLREIGASWLTANALRTAHAIAEGVLQELWSGEDEDAT